MRKTILLYINANAVYLKKNNFKKLFMINAPIIVHENNKFLINFLKHGKRCY